MDNQRELRVAGWVVPPTSRVMWTVVLSSIALYFVFGRAVANVIAIIGAVFLTYVIVKRDRSR